MLNQVAGIGLYLQFRVIAAACFSTSTEITLAIRSFALLHHPLPAEVEASSTAECAACHPHSRPDEHAPYRIVPLQPPSVRTS